VQLAEPSLEKVPGLQLEQTVAPLSLPVADPAAQIVQSLMLPVGAYLPVVQNSQEVRLERNVPGGQIRQMLRSGALNLISLH
jgi:hypothetical protein